MYVGELICKRNFSSINVLKLKLKSISKLFYVLVYLFIEFENLTIRLDDIENFDVENCDD